MSNKSRNLFFLVGLVAVVIMMVTFDVSFSELWMHIKRAGYWFPIILALWFGLYLMNTVTWRVLILGSGPCPIRFLTLFKWTVTGFALNNATPVGVLGGEPYKILESKAYLGTQRATSSVLLFSMTYVFSHFCYWATAVVAYVVLAAMGLAPMNTALAILIAVIGIFTMVGFYIFTLGYRYGMVFRLVNLLAHIPGLRRWGNGFIEKRGEDLKEIDRQISALHSQRKGCFYTAWVLEYLGRSLQSFEIMFVILLLDAGDASLLTFTYSYIILSFTSLFSNLLFIIPMQLGGREGGFAMTVALVGFSASVGFFISLICRVREILYTLIGLLLMRVKNP
ncbi:MAG: flippase-like domain-containing protein [Bacteroidaceae bacterium]|nr:flippase-like domain-containing protein [Bacteroidaceae bacterium]